MYGVLRGWVGASDVDSSSGRSVFADVDVFGSVLGVGVTPMDVNALTGSDRFKEKEAFSAQIAH